MGKEGPGGEGSGGLEGKGLKEEGLEVEGLGGSRWVNGKERGSRVLDRIRGVVVMFVG